MLQAPAAKTTLEVATFPSGVSTPTTFMWGRLSFCPIVLGCPYVHVAIYSTIHLFHWSCPNCLKLYLAVLNKNSRHRTALQHLGTSKHSSCVLRRLLEISQETNYQIGFQNLPKDKIQVFLLTPGIGCGETSGVDRAICGAVDPAQEVRDVQMGQQLWAVCCVFVFSLCQVVKLSSFGNLPPCIALGSPFLPGCLRSQQYLVLSYNIGSIFERYKYWCDGNGLIYFLDVKKGHIKIMPQLIGKFWTDVRSKMLFLLPFPFAETSPALIADIYISISMGTFGHRKYKSRGEDGNK